MANGRTFNSGEYVDDCQSASKFDPRSASNFDPLERRVRTVALAQVRFVPRERRHHAADSLPAVRFFVAIEFAIFDQIDIETDKFNVKILAFVALRREPRRSPSETLSVPSRRAGRRL